jgi:predicted O-methyltransferase YrrM
MPDMTRGFRVMAPKKRRYKSKAKNATRWDQIEGWCAFGAIYEDIVQQVQPGDILIEVGNYYGKSLAYLAALLKNKGAHIYGIDIGCGGPMQWDKEPRKRRGYTTGKLVKNLFTCNLLDDVTLIVRDSPKAAHLFADESVSFVMLDGDHSYDGVTRDIDAWWPKIKPGGLLAGDDYQLYPTVAKAVHDYFKVTSAQDARSPVAWSVLKPARTLT